MCHGQYGLMIAVALASLAYPSHGRRLQSSGKRLQGRSSSGCQASLKELQACLLPAVSPASSYTHYRCQATVNLSSLLAVHHLANLQAAFHASAAVGNLRSASGLRRRSLPIRRQGQVVLMRFAKGRSRSRSSQTQSLKPTEISPQDTERLSKAFQRVREEAPLQREVIVALEMLTKVPLDVRETMNKSSGEPCLLRPYRFSDGRLQPTGQSTRLAEEEVRHAVKLIGGDYLTRAEKQERLIALCTEALRSGRPRSAWSVFDSGKQYFEQADEENANTSARFIRGGLLAAIALRNESSYKGALSFAQQYMVNLRGDGGKLMSELMAACCEVGWLQRATSINSTLAAAGLMPNVDALNALMAALRLRLDDIDSINRTYEHMITYGPKPNSESYAFATQAAAERAGGWSQLHNAMQKKFLNIPWNQQSANAAYSQFVRESKLEEAVRVTNWMEYQKTQCNLGSFEELLRYASVSRDCAPTTLAIYEAMKVHAVSVRAMEDDHGDEDEEEEEENEPPISASTLLLVLPHVPPTERVAFCEEALKKSTDQFGWLEPEDNVKMQAALALIHAVNGNGRECASWLTSLHKEGVSLETLDGDSSLAFAMRRMQSDSKSPIDDFREILEDSPVDLETAKLGIRCSDRAISVRKDRQEGCKPLWLQALRACNDVEAGSQILKELGSCSDVSSELRAEALLEYLGVCNRACDAQKAWEGLSEFDEEAPVEAYLSVLMTCCSGVTPNIDLSVQVVVAMQRSWAFTKASPGQLLTMYVCLVRGHGQNDLDKASEVFANACAWMIKARQQQVGNGWSDDDWLQAKYALYRTMVEVAAPKGMRGLLFAVEICDQLEREDNVQLDYAVLAQFLQPCKNAQEMKYLVGPLLTVDNSDPNLRLASLGTISAIMAALKKSQDMPAVVAVYKLFEAGVRLEDRVRKMFERQYAWVAKIDPLNQMNPRYRSMVLSRLMAWHGDKSPSTDEDHEVGIENEEKLQRVGNANFQTTGKIRDAAGEAQQADEPRPKERTRKGKYGKKKWMQIKKQKEKEAAEKAEQAAEEYRRPRFR